MFPYFPLFFISSVHRELQRETTTHTRRVPLGLLPNDRFPFILLTNTLFTNWQSAHSKHVRTVLDVCFLFRPLHCRCIDFSLSRKLATLRYNSGRTDCSRYTRKWLVSCRLLWSATGFGSRMWLNTTENQRLFGRYKLFYCRPQKIDNTENGTPKVVTGINYVNHSAFYEKSSPRTKKR